MHVQRARHAARGAKRIAITVLLLAWNAADATNHWALCVQILRAFSHSCKALKTCVRYCYNYNLLVVTPYEWHRLHIIV